MAEDIPRCPKCSRPMMVIKSEPYRVFKGQEISLKTYGCEACSAPQKPLNPAEIRIMIEMFKGRFAEIKIKQDETEPDVQFLERVAIALAMLRHRFELPHPKEKQNG